MLKQSQSLLHFGITSSFTTWRNDKQESILDKTWNPRPKCCIRNDFFSGGPSLVLEEDSTKDEVWEGKAEEDDQKNTSTTHTSWTRRSTCIWTTTSMGHGKMIFAQTWSFTLSCYLWVTFDRLVTNTLNNAFSRRVLCFSCVCYLQLISTDFKRWRIIVCISNIIHSIAIILAGQIIFALISSWRWSFRKWCIELDAWIEIICKASGIGHFDPRCMFFLNLFSYTADVIDIPWFLHWHTSIFVHVSAIVSVKNGMMQMQI